jgi:hypothetical protein
MLKADNLKKQVKDEILLCIICQDNNKNMIFEPCHHICICEPCDKATPLADCPICRKVITSKSCVFLSY